MIGSLSGDIEHVDQNYVVVNVMGVGYIVYVTARDVVRCAVGVSVRFFVIEHRARDDVGALYGFFERVDLDCAKMLVKVNGISYKTVMIILGRLSAMQVYEAISTGNASMLKGVGAKLATRIIAELSQIVANHVSVIVSDPEAEFAMEALVRLGYDRVSVGRLVAEHRGKSAGDIVRIILEGMQSERTA